MGEELGLDADGSFHPIHRLCRYLSEQSPRPTLAVAGATHVVIYVNPAFALLVGKDRDVLKGRPFAEAVPEGHANGCLAVLDRVLRTGGAEDLAEQEHRQGGIYPVYWSYAAWAILGEDDHPAGVMIQVTDSTEAALLRRRTTDVNEALVVSAARQHELTEERTDQLSRALTSLEDESTERRRTERARLELLRRLVTIQEEERARISRELHDQMGQHIAALTMELQTLRDSFAESSASVALLCRLQEATAQVGEAMHRLAFELRPPLLDDMGLETAARDNLEEWSRRSGIASDFYASGFEHGRADSQVETTVYRVLQEALTNVAKHSRASKVGVVLEKRVNSIQLIVEDDGRGFDVETIMDAPDARRRLGLIGMEERVSMVGGTLALESRPGGPTTLYVRIPVHEGREKRKGDDD